MAKQLARPKRGRPTRAEATAKAMAALLVDPATIDPRQHPGRHRRGSISAGKRACGGCRALLGQRDPPEAGRRQR